MGVLLIEQFAHVALGLARKAYVLEGGHIRYDGTAEELQDNPEILRSAYFMAGPVADTARRRRATARTSVSAGQ